jgi:rhamnogalacturonyl hydrolase YesR
MVLKVAITIGFFAIAFFFSMVMNQVVHAFFTPGTAEYVIDAVSAGQILLILYATGFMDTIRKVKY